MPSSTNAAPSSPQRASDVEAARAELARCLRLLVHLFPDPDFVANPPEIAVLDEYPPLFGFNESCPMKIEARPGRLVIEARDLPQSRSAGLRTAPAPKLRTCV